MTMSSYSKSNEPQSSLQPLAFLSKPLPRKKRSSRRAKHFTPLRFSSPSDKGGSSRIGESVLPRQSLRSSETFTLALGNGENSVQLQKTDRNKKLAEIARVDPKGAKRVLARRQSSARYRDRQKVKALEKVVETLQKLLEVLSLKLPQMADPVCLEGLSSEQRTEFETLSKLVEVELVRNEAIAAQLPMMKTVTGKAKVGRPTKASQPEKA